MDTKQTLADLLTAELQELSHAEKAVLKLLPRLAKAAHTSELRETFLARVDQGKQQAAQIDARCKLLGIKRGTSDLIGLTGMLDGCSKVLETYGKGNLRDAALLVHMQRIDQYKIGSYSSLRDFATLLGQDEVVKLLEETVAADSLALKKLEQIAIQVNAEAFVDGNSPDCFLKHKE